MSEVSDEYDDETWFRGQSNDGGYFILKHLKTGRYLKIGEDNILTTGQFLFSSFIFFF